jgi:hypothetical protein
VFASRVHRCRLHAAPTKAMAVVVVAMLVLGTQPPAFAFDDPDQSMIRVYQPGGVDATVVEAARGVTARTGASWVPVHTGTLQMLAVTRGEQVIQEADPGFRIPMSTMAVDAGAAEPVVGRQIANALRSGAAVMGATSARLRGAEPGDVIEFIGWDQQIHTRRLALVVPDASVSWAELVFDESDAASFGFERVSSLLIWNIDHRDDVIVELWRSMPDRLLRLDSSDDAWDPDSTLPTVLIKERFGEFAYRETGRGDQIVMNDEWRTENIMDVNLPLVGPFRCHRVLVPLLEGALNDVVEAGLSAEISFADFQIAGGCWNPRLIRGGDKGGAVSRHAWGVAVDINPSTNPYGGVVDMHPAIVDIFRSWGFAWGGGWTFTDGGHFEWNRELGSVLRPPEQGGS